MRVKNMSVFAPERHNGPFLLSGLLFLQGTRRYNPPSPKWEFSWLTENIDESNSRGHRVHLGKKRRRKWSCRRVTSARDQDGTCSRRRSMRLKPFKKMTTIYTVTLFPLRSVKNHEVGPVVVSRSGNAGWGVGNMCAPRVNGMITSNGSTRDVSVGEERKK